MGGGDRGGPQERVAQMQVDVGVNPHRERLGEHGAGQPVVVGGGREQCAYQGDARLAQSGRLLVGAECVRVGGQPGQVLADDAVEAARVQQRRGPPYEIHRQPQPVVGDRQGAGGSQPAPRVVVGCGEVRQQEVAAAQVRRVRGLDPPGAAGLLQRDRHHLGCVPAYVRRGTGHPHA